MQNGNFLFDAEEDVNDGDNTDGKDNQDKDNHNKHGQNDDRHNRKDHNKDEHSKDPKYIYNYLLNTYHGRKWEIVLLKIVSLVLNYMKRTDLFQLFFLYTDN